MQRTRFILVTWIRSLVSARAATAVLSSFGALWLIIEITAFFFQSTAIPQWLRDHWWLRGAMPLG